MTVSGRSLNTNAPITRQGFRLYIRKALGSGENHSVRSLNPTIDKILSEGSKISEATDAADDESLAYNRFSRVYNRFSRVYNRFSR